MRARDLARMAVEDSKSLWALDERPVGSKIRLEFDDGTMMAGVRATIYSAYLWSMAFYYPQTRLLKEHHLGDRMVGTNTHLKMLSKLTFDGYEDYLALGKRLDVEALCRLAYITVNKLYNDSTYELEDEVQSISILDFIDVVEYPPIKKLNEQVQPTRRSVDQTQDGIRRILTDTTSVHLPDNAVARAARNGLVPIGQIIQSVGPRGFLGDVDSHVFRNPILNGFVHGIGSLEDSMKESRSATRAMGATDIPLKTTEVFNRQMQLFASVLANLHQGDCGSQSTITWTIKNDNDLRDLEGKYYVTVDGLKRLKRNDRHLLGKSIQLRSLFRCTHPDPQGVCEICFGDLALSIPAQTNLGHVAATALCEQVAQNTLSTKHLDSSASYVTMEVDEHGAKFIRVGEDGLAIKLADGLNPAKVKILIDHHQAKALADVGFVDDPSRLLVTNLSELTEVGFRVGNSKTHEIVTVSHGTRKSSLTTAMLRYIKKHGWSLTSTGDYEIDLKHWDTTEALFELPMRHLNPLDHMKLVMNFIRAGGTVRSKKTAKKATVKRKVGPKTLRDFDTPEEALVELHMIVSSKLLVSVSCLEVFILCSMMRSRDDLDYGIPRPGNKVEMGACVEMMNSRSLAAPFAFKDMKRLLAEPKTYLISNRLDHPLDPLFGQLAKK